MLDHLLHDFDNLVEEGLEQLVHFVEKFGNLVVEEHEEREDRDVEEALIVEHLEHLVEEASYPCENVHLGHHIEE